MRCSTVILVACLCLLAIVAEAQPRLPLLETRMRKNSEPFMLNGRLREYGDFSPSFRPSAEFVGRAPMVVIDGRVFTLRD
ncbi:unnamed protein product, partial [Mesorhabditis spiculigera]